MSVAVLPLQNLNGDFNADYLRFALADEIANVLTYSRTLDVRPSAVTRKYVGCGHGSAESRTGVARGQRFDRTLPEAGKPSPGHAGGDRDRHRPAGVADQSHRFHCRT